MGDHHMPAPPKDGVASSGAGAEIEVTEDRDALLRPVAGGPVTDAEAVVEGDIKVMGDHHMPAPPRD
ncbi:hypothetical protein BJP40_09025 [Streptomyces sp. CC53]|nr:hypothetical protein BJP40_09025 [Streptomyces sp. CC53]